MEGRDSIHNFHTCRFCPYRNKSLDVMSKHLQLHRTRSKRDTFKCNSNNPECFECKLCEFKTVIKVSLQNHISVFHKEKEASIDLRRALDCHKCEKCGFETYSLLVLLKHSCSNSKRKWFECEQCAYKVNTEYYLKQHIALRHSVTWHKCAHCTFKTKRRNLLKIHTLVVHRRENTKWFKCAKCPFKSKYKNILKIHKKSEAKKNQPEMNSVQYILKNYPLSDSDKLLIKQKGRPTPDLPIRMVSMVNSRPQNRWFNKNIYDKHEWICGCPVVNRLFCFVCLLFKTKLSSWSTYGTDNLKHLSESTKKHQFSVAHLGAYMSYAVLGKTNISKQLASGYLWNKVKHNEQVEKNRHILRRLIMCIRFCGAFELALRGHESSDNLGIYTGLINFAAELDAALALHLHLKEADVFNATPKTIQNELLDAMLAVYRAEIIKQIKSANFVALQADQVTDTSNHQQLVVIFRYFVDGQICERFWSFIRLETHTPERLAELLLNELEQVLSPEDNHKLISQSYDGGIVMSGEYNGVQAIIRKKYPNAHLVHCYAHQCDLVMEQAAQCHRNVRIFFANLQSFSNFFVRSSTRSAILEEIVKKRVPHAVPLKFKSRTLNTLFEYKHLVVESLEKIIDTPGVDATTISEAYGLMSHLKSAEFLYWVKIFYVIMPHVELLFNQAQTRGIDRLEMQENIAQFVQHMARVKSSIYHMDGTDDEIERDSRSLLVRKVFDNILTQIGERFNFGDHLSAARLFDSRYFRSYRVTFPRNHFNVTLKSYSMLNSPQLKNELSVIYERDDTWTLDGILSLLVFLEDNDSKTIFSETYKLLDIICTTPMATSERERCFPTLKKIKTFLRSTVSEDKLNALAVLSVEKTFIQSLPDFDNKVIDIFCNAKNRRTNFMYQ